MNAINQIFKDALRHEIRSGAFYEQAAKKTGNDEVRMLFLELSSMENTHAGEILDKVLAFSPHNDFDFSGYRKQLEESTKKDYSGHNLAPFFNFPLKKVLNIAIEKENKANKHYLSLSKNERNGEIKELYRTLANEEKGHSAHIAQLLSSLNMDEKDRPAL